MVDFIAIVFSWTVLAVINTITHFGVRNTKVAIPREFIELLTRFFTSERVFCHNRLASSLDCWAFGSAAVVLSAPKMGWWRCRLSAENPVEGKNRPGFFCPQDGLMKMYVECGKPCLKEKPRYFLTCWGTIYGVTMMIVIILCYWICSSGWVTSSLRPRLDGCHWFGFGRLWYGRFCVLIPWSMHWNILQRFLLYNRVGIEESAPFIVDVVCLCGRIWRLQGFARIWNICNDLQ